MWLKGIKKNWVGGEKWEAQENAFQPGVGPRTFLNTKKLLEC